MRANRTYGSEGGEASPSRPLSSDCKDRGLSPPPPGRGARPRHRACPTAAFCAMIGVLPMPSSPNHPREMSHDPAVCA